MFWMNIQQLDFQDLPQEVQSQLEVLGSPGEHIDKAEQLAQLALDGGYDWAECHAVIAEAREHAGDVVTAARSYLSAYEASPHSWQYLERYCKFVGRAFNAPTGPVSQLLTLPQLHDLMAFIDQALRGTECDGTLRHAKRWAEQSALDPVDLYQFFNGHGGFCDCEVCLNVESSLGDQQDVENA